MNNKIIKYCLIAGVTLVWSTIIFKVLKGSDEIDLRVEKKIISIEPINTKKEEFYLYANYPDPFIIEDDIDSIKDSQSPVTAGPLVKPSAAPVTIKPDYSYIQYHGMIVNPQMKTKVGLITLRGQDILIKEKEEKEKIVFKKLEPEKLTVIINGNKIEVLKN